jgi:protein-S-isoprenylcysteine O-methyltransferase Ste14
MLTATFWMGWLIALASTFQIDHFELFGLRQAVDALRGAADRTQAFRTPLLYRLVRHPLMLGLLLAFWATPHMTAGHLLFAVMNTAYILVGVRLEERDLIATFGASYERYRRRVPMLMPRLFGGNATASEARHGG